MNHKDTKEWRHAINCPGRRNSFVSLWFITYHGVPNAVVAPTSIPKSCPYSDQAEQTMQTEIPVGGIKPLFGRVHIAAAPASADCDRWYSHRHWDIGICRSDIELRLDAESACGFERRLNDCGLDRRRSGRPFSHHLQP